MVEAFIKTALIPVGRVMYVYGGGWNADDTGAGDEAKSIGMSGRWERLAEVCTADYDWTASKYRIHDGLDCSGYIGWAVYNTLYSENGHDGFVVKARDTARFLAERGLGEYYGCPVRQRRGDVISMRNHVYISLGEMEDSSVLLLHSSPPGVHMCGTVTADNSPESLAHTRACRYMERMHPNWYKRYPNRIKGIEYITEYTSFRWR